VHLQPDIILLDAIMPVMDGFTCCTQLEALWQQSACGIVFRQRWEAKRTPVLMITVPDDEASINRAFEVGAIVMLPSPSTGRCCVSACVVFSTIPTLQGAASKRTALPFQNASDVITIHATTGITYYVSESVHRILGYRCEDLVGNNILNLVHLMTRCR